MWERSGEVGEGCLCVGGGIGVISVWVYLEPGKERKEQLLLRYES